MTTHHLELTVTTSAQDFPQVNEELSRLKIVIGVLLAKLPPDQRSHFLNDLKALGLTEEVELYSNFSPA